MYLLIHPASYYVHYCFYLVYFITYIKSCYLICSLYDQELIFSIFQANGETHV